MTPAPISVERLPAKWRGEKDGSLTPWASNYNGALEACAKDLERALPALLHQLAERDAGNAALNAVCAATESKLAERDAEVERLRNEKNAMFIRARELAEQCGAAERAREGATGLLRRVNASLYLLDKPHREFGGVTDKTATDIAAFLAASGGA